MNPIQRRFSSLRRRLRWVIVFRGVCVCGSILLFSAAVIGLIDWLIVLPSFVRSVLLAAGLAVFGIVGYAYLIRPLSRKADDLSLALQVEEVFPELNDSLASAVQFLQQPTAQIHDSPALRRETVRQTMKRVEQIDFNRVVNSRGIGAAGLSLVTAIALFAFAFSWYPVIARIALARLIHPFGDVDWPKETLLALQFEQRVARGKPFEIRGQLQGVVPDHAVVTFEGVLPARQTVRIQRGMDEKSGTLFVRLDRVEHDFRFHVRANDASAGPFTILVQPPPVLVPRDGQASPQIRLLYPEYTDLPEQNLPAGIGNIEAVLGTRVLLKAQVDRPVAKAWIEFLPEQPMIQPAAFLGILGAHDLASAMALSAAASETWSTVPARLSSDRLKIDVSFLPRLRGMYALHFQDDTGLGNSRLFELRLFRDPPPVVNLERPSPGRDSLFVLPHADIAVRVSALDEQFAVKSCWLRYRVRSSAGESGPFYERPLFHHDDTGQTLMQLLNVGRAGPLPVLFFPSRVRSKRIVVERQLALSQLRGRPLQEGDVITLQALANDFDDVSIDKPPARSHEVELHIVGLPALEARILRDQQAIQQALLKLQKEQQDALERIIGAEQRWRKTGKLDRHDLDELTQAEQLQRQIRNRIGNRQAGLRSEVERILQAMRQNKLPASGDRNRLETVASELERLAREVLPQIEPRLTNARKENETRPNAQPPAKNEPGELGIARRKQEEVEATLSQLLELLEPWGSLNEVKGEARELLDEQKRLHDETRKLDTDATRGQKPEVLTPEQQAQLGRLAELQQKLAERASRLLQKMERAARDRAQTEPQLAEALREAARLARQGSSDSQTSRSSGPLEEQLNNAAGNLRQNKLSEAQRRQRQGMETLEEMIQALSDRREKELERLRKGIQELEKKLERLAQDQDRLRKKVKEAAKIADAGKRDEALKRLARQQEELNRRAEALKQELRRLHRHAGDTLERALSRMQDSLRQLQRGQDPEEKQEEALDRLQEARRRLQNQQQAVAEELAREKLAKVAKLLEGLRQRQKTIHEETIRNAERVIEKKQWDRIALANLGNLAEAQRLLADESSNLIREKLAGAKVFAHILGEAVAAMNEAAEHMKARGDQALDDPRNTAGDPVIVRSQQTALRRFDQLLSALKEDEKGGIVSPERQPTDDGGQPGGSPKIRDGIPALAQLKALRALQQEVNERTERFRREHPDSQHLKPEAEAELNRIKKEQEQIANLLEELSSVGQPEGENP
ncbi:MAG: hypothetical protein KatS3mg105_0515 [Gemmatales bacterium]|nr:MAG: hypothetical protein KatS3mg105_0515 [Gemmatales bacterium]